MILTKLRDVFKPNNIYWNEAFSILQVHVLDQSKGAARFRWHRDTEEDTASMRVYYSCVILLRGDDKVAGLQVAGKQIATYGKHTGHIFDSRLYHSTQEVDGAGGVKLGVFVGLSLR